MVKVYLVEALEAFAGLWAVLIGIGAVSAVLITVLDIGMITLAVFWLAVIVAWWLYKRRVSGRAVHVKAP